MLTTETSPKLKNGAQFDTERDLKVNENRERINAEHSRYQSRRREIERQLEQLDEEYHSAIQRLLREIENA